MQCDRQFLLDHGEQRFAYLSARALTLLGWCLVQEGATEDGIAHLREGLAAFRKTGALTTVPFGQALLAGALAGAGRHDEGLDVVAEALEQWLKSGDVLTVGCVVLRPPAGGVHGRRGFQHGLKAGGAEPPGHPRG